MGDGMGNEVAAEVRMAGERIAAIAGGGLRHAIVEDRFAPGDVLRLVPDAHPAGGAELLVRITYVTSADRPCALSPEGLAPGYAIVSLETA
jgi:hypothetical protein